MAIELYRNGKAAITKKRGLPNVSSIAKKTVKKYNFEKLCIHTKQQNNVSVYLRTMDHEESGLSGFTFLTPTSLAWQFHQQLLFFQNETHPNTTYNFKEAGQKGKQEPRCLSGKET